MNRKRVERGLRELKVGPSGQPQMPDSVKLCWVVKIWWLCNSMFTLVVHLPHVFD